MNIQVDSEVKPANTAAADRYAMPNKTPDTTDGNTELRDQFNQSAPAQDQVKTGTDGGDDGEAQDASGVEYHADGSQVD